MEIKVCHGAPGTCQEMSFLFAGFGGFGGFGGFPGGAGGPFGSGDLSSLGNMPQTVRNQNYTLYSLQNVSAELKILL